MHQISVEKWSAELFVLHQLKTKEQVIQQIAEVKELLHLCKEPIENIEQVFLDHPSAPEISPHHRGNYHCTLNRLVEFTSGYGVKTVADVTEHIAQAFLSYNWKRGISAKTYNSNLDILKRVFRLLCKDQNPFADFKKKSGSAEMRQAFTTEQLQKIWETLQSPDYHILYKEEMMVLYKLALYTGARCGDLCLLKWQAVVSPGPTQTGWIDEALEKAVIPLIPARKLIQPEDIAQTIIFLASSQAAMITSQIIKISGGRAL